MGLRTITLRGVIRPDGGLDLGMPLSLPPGPVQVVITLADEHPALHEDLTDMLERFRREQEESGHKPRTREEIDADLEELRDELDEHANAVERLQEQIWAEKNRSADLPRQYRRDLLNRRSTRLGAESGRSPCRPARERRSQG